MRLPLLVALMLVATSLATSVATAQDYRVKVMLPGWSRLPLALDTVATPIEIDAPAGRVFAALAAAMDELKIPVNIRDSVGGLVGNATLKQMYAFAGFPMARIQNCGIGAMGPNASSYRVHMALVGFIDELGPSKTRLRIAFAAGAADISGASKDATMCRSTGALEERLADLVKMKVR